jgi:sialic acid synthase
MKSTYIIGEIGQNHNGSVEIAKQLIDLSCRSVMNKALNRKLTPLSAIKLTKRDLKYELTNSALKSEYVNKHSFGKTYGEHRAFLELSDEEHKEIYQYTKNKGLDFVETLCSPSCLSILKGFTPDYLKVASRDLTNIPLLHTLAETEIPLIISTGMAGEIELDQAVKVITKYHENLCILHCVSEYPTKPENVNLKSILWLSEKYKNYRIGYSDHTIGISAAVAAVALGAEIIEKHITLDRSLKGTDQEGSLGPDGLNRMIRDIRIIEQSLGNVSIQIESGVNDARHKLERSLAYNKSLPKGYVITEDDIHMLSPGSGYKWGEKTKIIGQTLNRAIQGNELILQQDFANDNF